MRGQKTVRAVNLAHEDSTFNSYLYESRKGVSVRPDWGKLNQRGAILSTTYRDEDEKKQENEVIYTYSAVNAQ